jgi:predicted RNase H-like HicB family nuclease
MKQSARYAKIVAWSDEDQCYIGYAPGLSIGGCCHGDDEKAVFAELCDIVGELIEIDHQDGRPLPPPTAGYDFGCVLRGTIAKYESEGAPA